MSESTTKCSAQSFGNGFGEFYVQFLWMFENFAKNTLTDTLTDTLNRGWDSYWKSLTSVKTLFCGVKTRVIARHLKEWRVALFSQKSGDVSFAQETISLQLS